jgi:hypothetical protein
VLVVGEFGGALGSVGLPVHGTAVRPSRRRALSRGLTLLFFLVGVWVLFGALAGAAQAHDGLVHEVAPGEHATSRQVGDEPSGRSEDIGHSDDDPADDPEPVEAAPAPAPAVPVAPAPAVPAPPAAPAPATSAPAAPASAAPAAPAVPAPPPVTPPTTPSAPAVPAQPPAPAVPVAPGTPAVPTAAANQAPDGVVPAKQAPVGSATTVPVMAEQTPAGSTPTGSTPTGPALPMPRTSAEPTHPSETAAGTGVPGVADEHAGTPRTTGPDAVPAAGAGSPTLHQDVAVEEAVTAEEAGAPGAAAPAICVALGAAGPSGSTEPSAPPSERERGTAADEGTTRALAGGVAEEARAEPGGSYAGTKALALVPSSGSTDPAPAPPPPAPPLPPAPSAPAGSCTGISVGGQSSGGGQHGASALEHAVLGRGILVPPRSVAALRYTSDVGPVTDRADDPGSSPG